MLESEFGWKGVSFELDGDKVTYFNTIRENKCLCQDATNFDYDVLFLERNYPPQIDYLSIDIDPAEQTLKALKKLPWDRYRFSVITFETDIWHDGADVQDEQINFLEGLGYEMVVRNVANERNPYEDWWIDPQVVDANIVKKFKQVGRIAKESPECIFRS